MTKAQTKLDELVEASRDGGVQFARDMLSGLPLDHATKNLARAMVEVRKGMWDQGWTDQEVAEGLEAFSDAAMEEWKRLGNLAGSVIAGRA